MCVYIHTYIYIYIYIYRERERERELIYFIYGGGGSGLVAKSYPTLTTLWTVTHQAPLSMRFPRQEYRSGFSFPSPGGLPGPGIQPRSPALQECVYVKTIVTGDRASQLAQW